MIKNVIFIILFVVLYGGLFLIASGSNSKQLTDRNGYGEFTDSTYNCERFNVKIEFDEEWIVFDGVSLEKVLYSDYSYEEIQEMYGSTIDSIAFLGGAVSPQLQLICVAIKDQNIPENKLNENSMKSTLEYMKTGISGQGGTMGNTACYAINAKGSGNKMVVYGYDYTLNGETYSNFNCMTNTGSNSFIIIGSYENNEGFKQLTDFVENKLYFYSAT